jgi:2-polyprenyl-6-methoxyphenol hydroxylase-like FAD-dependent oxidoreductase
MAERDFDVLIAGASLAGSATAILLGQAGLRVALVERRADPAAFKRMCTHYIQCSAVPSLERLGLMSEILAAGGVRSSGRFWTRWGMVEAPRAEQLPPGVNIRREVLDPMIRARAAATPGVELMLGQTASEVVTEAGAVSGLRLRDRDNRERTVRAALVVGADGRSSSVAQLAGVPRRETPHGRFGFGAYFEGPQPEAAPDGTIWFLDPQWAAAFPTDSGLTFLGGMCTKDRLPEYRQDRLGFLQRYIAGLPQAPPIADCRVVSPVIGKADLPNVHRGPVAPGLALVGDAALATDPLFGVGCGWAVQSAEWLTDAVLPALRGEEALTAGLARYRRVHRRRLGLHTRMIEDYATGRPFSAPERLLFSAAAQDPATRLPFMRFGTRSAGAPAMVEAMARASRFHLTRAGARPGRRRAGALPAAAPSRRGAARSPAAR